MDCQLIYKRIFVNDDDKLFEEFKKLIATFINLFKSKGSNKDYLFSILDLDCISAL